MYINPIHNSPYREIIIVIIDMQSDKTQLNARVDKRLLEKMKNIVKSDKVQWVSYTHFIELAILEKIERLKK